MFQNFNEDAIAQFAVWSVISAKQLFELILYLIYSTLLHYDIPDPKTAVLNRQFKICDVIDKEKEQERAIISLLSSHIYISLADVIHLLIGMFGIVWPLGKVGLMLM